MKPEASVVVSPSDLLTLEDSKIATAVMSLTEPIEAREKKLCSFLPSDFARNYAQQLEKRFHSQKQLFRVTEEHSQLTKKSSRVLNRDLFTAEKDHKEDSAAVKNATESSNDDRARKKTLAKSVMKFLVQTMEVSSLYGKSKCKKKLI